MDGQQHKHNPSLDGLRGVAALIVVIHHTTFAAHHFEIFSHGALAVDFFFLLSGYVISSSYERRLQNGKISLDEYLIKRAIRLYPMISFGALLGLISAFVYRPDINLGVAFLGQLLLIPTLTGGITFFPLNGPYWSLVFEIGANIVHGVAARYLTTTRICWACALSLAGLIWTTLAHGDFTGGWKTTDWIDGVFRVGFSYTAGMLVYRLRSHGRMPGVRLPFYLVASLLALMIGIASLGSGWTDLALIALAFPATLIIGINARCEGRWAKLAIFSGAVSYPLYATHMPLVNAFEPLIRQHHLLALGVTVAAVLLAWVAERYYERNVRRLFTKWATIRDQRNSIPGDETPNA